MKGFLINTSQPLKITLLFLRKFLGWGVGSFIIIAAIIWIWPYQGIGQIKSICSAASYPANMYAWESCLKSKYITPDDTDIRKQCFLVASDAHLNDPAMSKNSLYIDCIHSEGLQN